MAAYIVQYTNDNKNHFDVLILFGTYSHFKVCTFTSVQGLHQYFTVFQSLFVSLLQLNSFTAMDVDVLQLESNRSLPNTFLVEDVEDDSLSVNIKPTIFG